jgi:hypothetical protein
MSAPPATAKRRGYKGRAETEAGGQGDELIVGELRGRRG